LPVLAVGRRALDAAFGAAVGRRWSPPGPRPLDGMDDARLRLLLAAPWSVRPLRRRTILWALAGGSPAVYAGRMAWMRMSDGVRGGLNLATRLAQGRPAGRRDGPGEPRP
jgi:hypothetical protein